MDKKAVDILFSKYWSSAGWKTNGEISKDDFEYAKSKNVMFDDLKINHEKTIKWLTEEFNSTSKKHIVKCFLSSLSNRRLDLRSGLSCYAFSRNFPIHNFFASPHEFCEICGSFNIEEREEDVSLFNFERLKWGGVRLTDPLFVAWNLNMLNKETTPEPNDTDITILKEMISIITQGDEQIGQIN